MVNYYSTKSAQSTALVANGVIHDYPLISSFIQNYTRKIAVDGGLIHCQAMNIVPDLIIGDLDSISHEILNLYPLVPKKIFPKDKNFTDMELAIAEANSNKIGIFGALEGRADHALVNLHLLCRRPKKITIETERETIVGIKGNQRFPCYPGQLISLIPLGSSVTGVTTKGLKWELNNATLDKNFFSLSNACLSSSFEVSIDHGDLICCLLR
jgi:thiamine pyrophosphokinase